MGPRAGTDELKGAEAVLRKTDFLGFPAVEKLRVEKKYRNSALDRRIRGERTRREARLLARAKSADVFCPVVYCVGEVSITMKFLKGMMLHLALRGRKARGREKDGAGRKLARL